MNKGTSHKVLNLKIADLFWILFISTMVVVGLDSFSESAEPKDLNSFSGPLRVHPHNRRYFTDGTGKAIYLTGSHVWDNLQDWGGKTPKFDYTAYLNFLNKNKPLAPPGGESK